MKFALVQIERNYMGDDRLSEKCFIMVDTFDELYKAQDARDQTGRPEWFIIIQVF